MASLQRLGAILLNMLAAVPRGMVCGLASAAFGANSLAIVSAINTGHFALPADRGAGWMPIDLFFMGAAVSVACLLSSVLLKRRKMEHWWTYGLIGISLAFVILIVTEAANRPVETLLASGFGGIAHWFTSLRIFRPHLDNRVIMIGGLASLLLMTSSGVWLFFQADAEDRAPILTTGTAPIRAVATTRALWLMIDENTLVEHDIATQNDRRLDQKDLRALAAIGDTVWALSDHMETLSSSPSKTLYASRSGTIELRAYGANGGQKSWVRHHDAGDRPVAMTLANGRPLILTERKILRLASDRQWLVSPWRKPASERLYDIHITMAAGDANHLYGGSDGGEFGGGAFLIDLRNGHYERIERRDSSDLCAGPLNTECSPVTGLAPDPARAECVLASTGLEHMGGINGAILRLCGHKVEVVSQAGLAPMLDLWSRAVNGGMGNGLSDAVYGLTKGTNGTVWAMGGHWLYRIDRTGLRRISPPRFERHGDLRSATIPSLTLIAGPGIRNNLPTGQNVILVPTQD